MLNFLIAWHSAITSAPNDFDILQRTLVRLSDGRTDDRERVFPRCSSLPAHKFNRSALTSCKAHRLKSVAYVKRGVKRGQEHYMYGEAR